MPGIDDDWSNAAYYEPDSLNARAVQDKLDSLDTQGFSWDDPEELLDDDEELEGFTEADF